MISNYLSKLNNSKYLAGLTMILLNIAPRFVSIEFSKSQEKLLKNGLARELLIFAMCFMATRDIVISLILTTSFTLLSRFLLNENSKLCVLPKQMRKIAMEIDLNNDNIITQEEIDNAVNVLQKAKKQVKKKQQLEFLSNLRGYENFTSLDISSLK